MAKEKMTAARREKAAGVTVGKRKKFPVDNKHSADSAAHLINNARPALSSGQRASVVRNIHKYDPGVAIPPAKGSKSKKDK